MNRAPGKNITAKICALILAVILWMYVVNEQNPSVEMTFTVPLEVRNLSSSVILVDAPDSVRVKIRGPRSTMVAIVAGDIKAYLDVKGLGEGRHAVKVNAQAPLGVEVAEVNPDRVQLLMESGLSRQIPVEVRLAGTLASGIAVAKTTAAPEQVTIEGPRSLVDAVDKVIAVVDVSNKTTDFSTHVVLNVINREGKEVEGLTVYPDKVNVSAVLTRSQIKKTVGIKPVVVGDLAAGLTVKAVTTDPDKLEVSGSPVALERLDSVATEPINITGVAKDFSKEVKLQLKDGITASRATVMVNISVAPKPKGEE